MFGGGAFAGGGGAQQQQQQQPVAKDDVDWLPLLEQLRGEGKFSYFTERNKYDWEPHAGAPHLTTTTTTTLGKALGPHAYSTANLDEINRLLLSNQDVFVYSPPAPVDSFSSSPGGGETTSRLSVFSALGSSGGGGNKDMEEEEEEVRVSPVMRLDDLQAWLKTPPAQPAQQQHYTISPFATSTTTTTPSWSKLSPSTQASWSSNSQVFTPPSASSSSSPSSSSSSSGEKRWADLFAPPLSLSKKSTDDDDDDKEEQENVKPTCAATPPLQQQRKRLPNLPARNWVGQPPPRLLATLPPPPVVGKPPTPRVDDENDTENQPPPPSPTLPQHRDAKNAGLPPLAPPPALPSWTFFGDTNYDFDTIVLGRQNIAAAPSSSSSSSRHQVQLRLDQLKKVTNLGFGVVPIMNSFTVENSASRSVGPAGGGGGGVGRRPHAGASSSSSSAFHFTMASLAALRTTSAAVRPEAHELGQLVLYQLGLPCGRQALFQGVQRTTVDRTRVGDLVGQFVVVEQDDGVEVGLLRAWEPLAEAVPGIPEAPFMRILKLAGRRELAQLDKKREDESRMLELTRQPRITALAPQLDVQFCEFQFDRRKLITYTCMTDYVDFREYVTALHSTCEVQLGYAVRVFVQRKFVAVTSSSSSCSSASGASSSSLHGGRDGANRASNRSRKY